MTFEDNSSSIPKLSGSASTGCLREKVNDNARTLTPSHSLDNLHNPGRLVLTSHIWNGIDSTVKLAPPLHHNLADEEERYVLAESSSVASLLSVGSDSVAPPSHPPPSSQLNTGNVLRHQCNTSPIMAGYVPAVVAEHIKNIEEAHALSRDRSKGSLAPESGTVSPVTAKAPLHSAPATCTIAPLPQHQHVPTPTWVIEEVIEFCPPTDDSMLQECDAVSFARSSTNIMFDGCYRHPCFDDRCERISGERKPVHFSEAPLQERKPERSRNLQEI